MPLLHLCMDLAQVTVWLLITTKKGSSSSGAGVTLSISQGWSSRAYNDYAKVGVYDYYPLQWQMFKRKYVTRTKCYRRCR